MQQPTFLLLAFFCGPFFLSANSPIGLWKTVDDTTGIVKSIVEIYPADDHTLEGRVIEILHSDYGPDPKCVKCKGERKDQPVKGMVILWGVSGDGGTWSGGKVLDPKNGKVYSCKLEVNETGNLELRGYLGVSLFGRTQTWLRVD